MAAAAWTARVMGITSALIVIGACASPPIIVTPPGPGVPVISALEIAPARTEPGCPIVLSIQFEDAGADVVRAVARWWARTGYQRHHDGTDLLPVAPAQFRGKSTGRADVVIVPPHAGNYVYRVQLEDAQGHSSNIAEARVYVTLRPFWRARRCQALDSHQSRDWGKAPEVGGSPAEERVVATSETMPPHLRLERHVVARLPG